jgi:hypothetical protein
MEIGRTSSAVQAQYVPRTSAPAAAPQRPAGGDGDRDGDDGVKASVPSGTTATMGTLINTTA